MSLPLHLLLMTEGFAPDDTAGAGRWAFEVARRLCDRGLRVTAVVRRCRPGLLAEESIAGISVVRYGSGRHAESAPHGLLDIGDGVRLVRRILKNTTIDICHFCQPLSGFIALRAMTRNLPLVYTYFSPWHEEHLVNRGRAAPALSPGYWSRYAIERLVIRRCPDIIVLSEFSRGQVERYHRCGSRCVTIPGGVDTARFCVVEDKSALRRSLDIAQDTLVFFTLRNLRPRMGLFNLLDAMAMMQKRLPAFRLIIGGAGPLAGALREKIAALGLEAVVSLAGKIPDENLPAWYQASDLFVLPTEKLEGFGLITLEALACGIPVVATPVGATTELLAPFNNGLLSKSEQPADLADALLKAVEMVNDPGLNASACRAYALRFTWEMVGDRVAQVYREVIAGTGSRDGVR
ncbi:MAG: glycosyltransferase family 4 protein [Chitinispirillaceae bacterium]|nr:glycosyltransferase family 4 protein [Chitinispirillaceae bacterium]